MKWRGITTSALLLVIAAAGTAAWLSRARERALSDAPSSAPVAAHRPSAGRPAQSIPLVGQLRAGRVVLDALEFIGPNDSLGTSTDRVLSDLAAALAAVPGTFLVEAHVAPSGNAMTDHWVTDRRAALVRARLVAAGVPAARLVAMGFGATRMARGAGHATASRIEISRMP